MRPDPLRVLGALLALAVLVLLLRLGRDEPAPVAVTAPTADTPPAAGPVAPQRLAVPPPPPGNEDSSLLEGTVRTSTGDLVPAGAVDFAPLPSAPEPPTTRVPLAGGRFEYPSTWTESGLPDAERFLVLDPSGSPSPVLRAEEDADGGLVLTVGRARPWTVRVTDLRDRPIPGARVMAYAGPSMRDFEVAADEQGVARGTLYTDGEVLGFLAWVPGHARTGRHVTAPTPEANVVIALPRLFIAGAYAQARPDLTITTLFDQDESAHLVTADFLDPVTRAAFHDLNPVFRNGRMRFFSVLRENEWLESAPTMEVSTLRVGPSGLERLKDADLAFEPLTNGVPRLEDLPEEMYEGVTTESHQVAIRVVPGDAFLAPSPDELRIPLRKPGDGKPFLSPAVRSPHAGNVYTLWLPEGVYEVLPGFERSRPEGWEIGHEPHFRGGELLTSPPATDGAVSVELADGEAYVRVDFTVHGRPTALPAYLAPADGIPRTRVAHADDLPRGRFVRPGSWDAWAFDATPEEGSIAFVAVATRGIPWPPSVLPRDGLWVVELQDLDRRPESFILWH